MIHTRKFRYANLILLLSLLFSLCSCQSWRVDTDNFDYSPYFTQIFTKIPKEYRNAVIILPQTVEYTIEGIDIHLDFFKEEYKMGEYIQLRATLINNSGKDFIYARRALSFPGMFQQRSDSRIVRSKSFDWSLADPEMPTYGIDDEGLREWKQDERLVVERIYFADPEFFISEHDIVFAFQCGTMYLTTSSDFTEEQTSGGILTFDVPVTVKN